MHIRQKVIEKFEAILETIVQSDRISKTMRPIISDTQGVFSVNTFEETVNVRSRDVGTPVYYQRELKVGIDIAIANTEQTNRFLIHDLCQIVEEAIADEDEDLGGLVDDHTLVGFDVEHSNDSAQTLVGTITYVVDYTTLATDVSQNTT